MYLLLSSAADSYNETDAHLNFYNLIKTLRSFGVDARRASGHSELYTPRDGYDLPKPKRYRTLYNLLIEVHKDAFTQFLTDLNCYTGWFNDEDHVNFYASNFKLLEKLEFIEKYNIPLNKSEPDDLDYLCCQSGILSLKELMLAIHQYIAEQKPTYSSIDYSIISDIDDLNADYYTSIEKPNVSNFRLLKFPDFKKCESAFLLNLACTSPSYYRQNFNKTPAEDFILGHFLSPYHPSAKRLYEIFDYIFLGDLCDDDKQDGNFDEIYARCKEFIPDLSRKTFDEDTFDTVLFCILASLEKDIPRFRLPEGIGKLDFLMPLNYFEKIHYTDEDRQKSLEISRQMSAEVYEAAGPALSSFESGDD